MLVPYECLPWYLQTEKAEWRAFSIITRELARHIQTTPTTHVVSRSLLLMCGIGVWDDTEHIQG
jgi:hypothetical protein